MVLFGAIIMDNAAMSLTDFFFKWKTFLVEHLIEILVAVF